MRVLSSLFILALRAVHRLMGVAHANRFPKRGHGLRVCHGCDFTYDRIEVGDDVFIEPHPRFSVSESKIVIGNKVMFGPGVTITAGDHNTGVDGMYMADVHEKRAGGDLRFTIKSDCWIGADVTILKGATVGAGR